MNKKIVLILLFSLISCAQLPASKTALREIPTQGAILTDKDPERLPFTGVTEDFTEKLKRQIKTQSDQITTLQDLLNQLKTQTIDNQKALSSSNTSLAKTREELTEAKKELETQRARATEFETKMRETEALTAKQAEDSSKSAEKLAQLTDLTERQSQDLEKMESEKKASEVALESAKKDLSELQQKLLAQQTDSSTTAAHAEELATAEIQRQEAQQTIAHREADIQTLKAQLASHQHALAGSDIQVASLLEIHQLVATTFAGLSTLPEKIKTALAEKQAETTRAVKALAEKVTLIKQLELQIAQLTKDLAATEHLRKQMTQLTEELATQKLLTKDVESLKFQLTEKETTALALSQAMEKLKSSSQAPVTQLKARLALLQQLFTTQLPQIVQHVAFLKEQLQALHERVKSTKEFDAKMLQLKKQLATLTEEVEKYLGRTSAITVATNSHDSKKVQKLEQKNTELLAELQKLSNINRSLTQQFNELQQALTDAQESEPEDSKVSQQLAETQRQLEDLKQENEEKLAALEKQRTQDQIDALKELSSRRELDTLAARVSDNRLTDRSAQLASDASLAAAGASGLATASGLASTSGLAASARLMDRTPAPSNVSIIPYGSNQPLGMMGTSLMPPAVPAQYRGAVNQLTGLPFYPTGIKPTQSEHNNNLYLTFMQSSNHVTTLVTYINKNLSLQRSPDQLKILRAPLLLAIKNLITYVYEYASKYQSAIKNQGIAKLDEINSRLILPLRPIEQKILSIPRTSGEITLDEITMIINRNRSLLSQQV